MSSSALCVVASLIAGYYIHLYFKSTCSLCSGLPLVEVPGYQEPDYEVMSSSQQDSKSQQQNTNDDENNDENQANKSANQNTDDVNTDSESANENSDNLWPQQPDGITEEDKTYMKALGKSLSQLKSKFDSAVKPEHRKNKLSNLWPVPAAGRLQQTRTLGNEFPNQESAPMRNLVEAPQTNIDTDEPEKSDES